MGMGDIRVAEPSHADADADAVASILADGFSDDPIMRWVFEPADREQGPYTFFRFIAGVAAIPNGATYLCGDEAAAVWTPPNTPPWPPARGIAFAEQISAVTQAGTLERIAALDDATKQVHPQEPHWYLGILATRCEVQGKGIGGKLLAHCLERVDEAGLPAYLESSNPRNVPFYERFGFRGTRQIELPGGPSLLAMWREAEVGR